MYEYTFRYIKTGRETYTVQKNHIIYSIANVRSLIRLQLKEIQLKKVFIYISNRIFLLHIQCMMIHRIYANEKGRKIKKRHCVLKLTFKGTYRFECKKKHNLVIQKIIVITLIHFKPRIDLGFYAACLWKWEPRKWLFMYSQ